MFCFFVLITLSKKKKNRNQLHLIHLKWKLKYSKGIYLVPVTYKLTQKKKIKS